ncbi:hypothetical protein Pyn_05074 [Prunus yedoensis var. nudiflora]|uniref:Uncharacterized protein n=1 Tax=Prunus yedoensis var. nudiflora TaxID=2094558 RepID=A0A314U992_PRUYE|nr:hypothetical protein Pyn_05074 [Prunus yedoensis var. nudiflora]
MVESEVGDGEEGEGVGEATRGCCGGDGWVRRRRRVGMGAEKGKGEENCGGVGGGWVWICDGGGGLGLWVLGSFGGWSLQVLVMEELGRRGEKKTAGEWGRMGLDL